MTALHPIRFGALNDRLLCPTHLEAAAEKMGRQCLDVAGITSEHYSASYLRGCAMRVAQVVGRFHEGGKAGAFYQPSAALGHACLAALGVNPEPYASGYLAQVAFRFATIVGRYYAGQGYRDVASEAFAHPDYLVFIGATRCIP